MNLLQGSRQNWIRRLILSVIVGVSFSASARAMDVVSEQLTASVSPAEPVIASVEDLAELFQLGYQYPQAWTWQPAQYEPVTVLWFRPDNSGGQPPAPWENPDFGPVPQIVIHVHLANIHDAPTYYANLAAEAEELAAGLELLKAGGTAFTSSFSEVSSNAESGGGAAMMTLLSSLPCSAAIPVTLITQTTTGNVRIEWKSETNEVYAVRYTDALATFSDVPPLFQLWLPAEDNIASQGASTGWEDAGSGSRLPPSDTNVVSRFYRILKQDENFGVPCVRVASPETGALVSGLVNVEIAAVDDSRIGSLTLIVDGTEYATITGGSTMIPWNTVVYTNGSHPIQVRATDNQGIATLGGNPDSDIVANVALSEIVEVIIANAITATAFPIFRSQLPIHLSLTDAIADWSVSIAHETSGVVRVLSGVTSNGVVDVTWDGLNSAGQAVPEDAVYFLTITSIPTGGFSSLSSNPTNVAMLASYKEAEWNTGITLLARQKLKCRFPANCTWDTVSAAKLIAIQTVLEGVNTHPGIYSGSPLVMQTATDWDDLRTAIGDTNVRQFYYNGHSNGGQIGFNEFTPTIGIYSTEVQAQLQNFVTIPPGQTLYVVKFERPFKLVFIDGCLSATGDWPESFGTLKYDADYSLAGGKNRAFMGWKDVTVSSLFGNAHDLFTRRFWENWTAVEDRRLAQVIADTFAVTPGADPTKFQRYGYPDLTWEE